MSPRNDNTDLAGALQEVAERTQQLVHDEIELAKAEVTVKVKKLARGAAIGAAAGIFALAGLIYFLHSMSWLAFILVKDDGRSVWLGYLIVAGLLFLAGVVAGLLAARLFKSGSPPTPQMAIAEGRLIKDTLTGDAQPQDAAHQPQIGDRP